MADPRVVACALCGRQVAEVDVFVAAPDHPIDGVDRACSSCHEEWRQLLLEMLREGAQAGRGFITAMIAAAKAYRAGKETAKPTRAAGWHPFTPYPSGSPHLDGVCCVCGDYHEAGGG